MDKRVLLTEQLPRRALSANGVVAAYLEREAIRTRLSLTGAQLCSNLLRFKPHLVYWPWVTPFVYNFLRRRTQDIPIVNAYQEQGQALHNPEGAMVKWAGKADYLFAWGDAFKRRFDELYDKPEIINTGNPRFDPYLNPEIADTLYPSRAQLASRYDLDPEKDWVLLALDFPLLFTSDARLKELIDQGDASHERIEVMRKVYDQLRTWTRRWDSEEGDSAILIVRPHPASNLEKIEGDFGEESSGLRYIEGGAISPWIIAVDRYVTRASTSTVEAWLADTPAGLIGRDMHLDAGIEREHIREAQVTVDTYSEFSEYINATELRSSQDAHHSFLSTHFRLDGHASQRTAHELKRIALRQRENPTLKGGRPENIFRHIQFIIKKTINETGINKLNPFERPNENFLSRHKGKQIVKNIGEKIG